MERITIDVNTSEKNMIERAAKVRRQSPSNWCRHVLLSEAEATVKSEEKDNDTLPRRDPSQTARMSKQDLLLALSRRQGGSVVEPPSSSAVSQDKRIDLK